MLEIILQALTELLQTQNQRHTKEECMALFNDKIGLESFSGKDYLQHFKEISAPTASRDLKWAVEEGVLVKIGDLRLTRYVFKDTSYNHKNRF